MELTDPARVALVLDHAEAQLDRVEYLLHGLFPRPLLESAELDQRNGQASLRLTSLRRDALDLDLLLPDQHLANRAPLGAFETDVLWLAAAPYLDPELREAFARANDNILRDFADPALALRALTSSRADRLAAGSTFEPGAALFASGLMSLRPRDLAPHNPMLAELVPADHAVAWLRGRRALGAAASRFGRWLTPTLGIDQVPNLERAVGLLFPVVDGFLSRPRPQERRFAPGGLHASRGAAILLHGPPGSGRTLTIKTVAGHFGLGVILLDGLALSSAPIQTATTALEAACAEAALYGELLVIQNAEPVIHASSPLAAAFGRQLVDRPVLSCLCTADESAVDPSVDRSVLLRQPFERPSDRDSLRRIWEVNLPDPIALGARVNLKTVVRKVHLSPQQVQKAAQLAYLIAEPNPDPDGRPLLAEAPTLEIASRAQVQSNMGGLARASDSGLRLTDLILDTDTEAQILSILAAVRSRDIVLHEWGLGQRISRGTGIICLFDGEPGTGKTLAAEVIAGELGLKLMMINVSSIVDKYIGETEKNLQRVFDIARPDISLLLFDEADSLFSKRTEVKHSNDRYSNMDINVLLQLIERYEGVTVLTTNLKKSIDPAFERRISFKLHFPTPDAPVRVRLWKHMLPDDIPTAETIDYDYLGEIELAGGGIKNAVLRAAYTAAQQGELIAMEHLVRAIQHEVAAEGRLIRAIDW